MGDKRKEDMKPESNVNEFELKDQGNKYFALYKYVDALQCYNKAIVSIRVRDRNSIESIVQNSN